MKTIKMHQPKIIKIKTETLKILSKSALDTQFSTSKPFIEFILDEIAKDESLMQMFIQRANAICAHLQPCANA